MVRRTGVGGALQPQHGRRLSERVQGLGRRDAPGVHVAEQRFGVSRMVAGADEPYSEKRGQALTPHRSVPGVADFFELPSFHAAAAGLITASGTDRVLLVKPIYRDDWSLPGGYVEATEYPHDACARELHEELGLAVKPGALLVVDWAPPEGKRPRAMVSMTFDCGDLPADAEITLAAGELDGWAFLPPDDAAARLPANVAPRIFAALRARAGGETVYLPGASA